MIIMQLGLAGATPNASASGNFGDEQLHAFGVDLGQHQGVEFSIHGRNCAISVGVLVGEHRLEHAIHTAECQCFTQLGCDRGLDDRARWYLGWRRRDDRGLASSGLARTLGSFRVRQQSDFDDFFTHACHPDCAGVGTRDGGRFIYCSLDDLGYRDSSSHYVESIGHGVVRFLACPSFCISDFLLKEGRKSSAEQGVIDLAPESCSS
jgi:hypothetical protein